MILKDLKELIQKAREKGATDNSTIYTLDGCDFSHVMTLDYDPDDNSINIIPE